MNELSSQLIVQEVVRRLQERQNGTPTIPIGVSARHCHLKEKDTGLRKRRIYYSWIGYRDIYLGVPTILGGNGVESIIELPLTPEEKDALERSAHSVKRVINQLR